MPAQPQTYNDGGVRHGSRKIKLYPKGADDALGGSNWSASIAKGIYVAETFPNTRPTSTQDRFDEVNQPNAGFGTPGVQRFSLTTQLASNATPEIMPGDAFTTVGVDPTTGAVIDRTIKESYVVESVDTPESQGEITKQTIRVKRLYGTPANWPALYDWLA